MPKVHCVNDARVHGVKLEMDGATPIVPLRAVVLQFPAPQTIDEWEIPPAALSVAVHPSTAREIAAALLRAAQELDQ